MMNVQPCGRQNPSNERLALAGTELSRHPRTLPATAEKKMRHTVCVQLRAPCKLQPKSPNDPTTVVYDDKADSVRHVYILTHIPLLIYLTVDACSYELFYLTTPFTATSKYGA